MIVDPGHGRDPHLRLKDIGIFTPKLIEALLVLTAEPTAKHTMGPFTQHVQSLVLRIESSAGPEGENSKRQAQREKETEVVLRSARKLEARLTAVNPADERRIGKST